MGSGEDEGCIMSPGRNGGSETMLSVKEIKIITNSSSIIISDIKVKTRVKKNVPIKHEIIMTFLKVLFGCKF